MAAGSEVSLPPALIQQAYEQVQQEQTAAEHKKAQKKKHYKIGGVIAAASILFTALWTGNTYNTLSSGQTTVESKWAQVENQMQRRADLIPQLTHIAQNHADRESAVIQSLSSARERFLTATTVEEQQAADSTMKRAIADFQTFATNTEAVQSSELFINLQYEIAGTENRIATERMRYNQAIEGYNRSVASFPTTIIAKPMGFETRPFFQATP